MQKKIILIALITLTCSSLTPSPLAPPFLSKDMVDDFLNVMTALGKKDFETAIRIVRKNPEVLDNTILSKDLYSTQFSRKLDQTNSIQDENARILSQTLVHSRRGHNAETEHHILDIAAQYGTPEFVEFMFKKFLERNKTPMPYYFSIEKCIKKDNETLEKSLFCSLKNFAQFAENPIIVAVKSGKLKVVKTIVEFVKAYYKKQNLPLPRSFFNSGFIGKIHVGIFPEFEFYLSKKPDNFDLEYHRNQPSQDPYLIEYVQCGPLFFALNYGYKDIAQYLINEGALDDTPKQAGLIPGDGYLPIGFYNDAASPERIEGMYLRKSYTVDLAQYARESGLTIPNTTESTM